MQIGQFIVLSCLDVLAFSRKYRDNSNHSEDIGTEPSRGFFRLWIGVHHAAEFRLLFIRLLACKSCSKVELFVRPAVEILSGP